MNPQVLTRIDDAVDQVLARIDGPIVLALPLGIGKPNAFVNRLYEHMRADPTRRLTIVTALSLEKPTGASELERAFLDPIVERVFKDYPDLAYVKDARAGRLPAHIEVREFFMKTGDYLHNDAAQQHYICTNYSFAARDMLQQGINVLAQAVAAGDDGALSLSSNPDVTAELAERMAAAGKPLLKIACVNGEMPFMLGDAVVLPSFFDIVVTDPAGTHTLFGPPNNKVGAADYAIGLHAASLVPPVLQACFAAANPPGLGANVAVGCESFPLAAPGDYFEGSRQFRIYRITATAQIPGPGLTVERQFRVVVEKCIDNAVPGAPMECLR